MEEGGRLTGHPYILLQCTNNAYPGISNHKYYQTCECLICNQRQFQTNFQRHSDTEETHNQSMDSARLLPMKNTHLKILKTISVKNDDSIMGSYDSSVA